VSEEKKRSIQDGKDILAVTRSFLQALLDKEDWHEFGQKHYIGTLLEPSIPQFYRFKALMTKKLKGGNPLVIKRVMIRLQLVPSSHEGLRWADYRMIAVKESEPYKPDEEGTWGICPTSCRFVAWRNEG